jgi:hypothetical protein
LTRADEVRRTEEASARASMELATNEGMSHAPTIHYTREGIPLEPTAVRLRIASGGLLSIAALIVSVLGVAY